MGGRSRAGAVALVSGGLDSCCLVRTLLRQGTDVFPFYVRCGLVWESAELFWLRRWLAAIRQPRFHALTVIDVPLHSVYRRHWSLTGRRVPSRTSSDAAVYLPGRNVLLLSAAAILAAQHDCSTLALGTLAGNPFSDATPAFFRRFAGCLSRALARPFRISAPLRRFTKSRLIASMPREPFSLTFSCLAPKGRRHCGRCNKCAERQRAFVAARIPDPTVYVT